MVLTNKRIRWSVLLLLIGPLSVGVLSFGRSLSGLSVDTAMSRSSREAPTQSSSTTFERPGPRNLSFQPEALKLSRRVGRRFDSSSRQTSFSNGTLTVMGQALPVEIVRRQLSRGERVEITVTGQPTLVWSDTDGASSTGGALTTRERLLVERLVLDSVDQFILSQLRGASYQVVATKVRADESSGADNYRGPTWDVIRIDDPDNDEQRRPLSRWRLYYINTSTGVIDRAVYEAAGETVEVNFEEWTAQNGEVSPRHITWRQNGRIAMDLSLTSFVCLAN